MNGVMVGAALNPDDHGYKLSITRMSLLFRFAGCKFVKLECRFYLHEWRLRYQERANIDPSKLVLLPLDN